MKNYVIKTNYTLFGKPTELILRRSPTFRAETIRCGLLRKTFAIDIRSRHCGEIEKKFEECKSKNQIWVSPAEDFVLVIIKITEGYCTSLKKQIVRCTPI